MIVESNHAEAIISSDMETAEAQVALTPELMELLSSGIYTDKILAVVREISCNALDGHRAGNNEDPIEVHMPTTWEQWFSVRDRGIGLSHEDIMNLYITYGESRKRDTNDLIGGFGIGSKSPFAYTDAFTVTSWFEGEKRVYSVYKNAGIPNCTLLTTEECGDEVGIEVKVPVKSVDIHTFRVKAEQVYKAFDTKPDTNINIDVSLNVKEEGENYFTVHGGYNGGKFYAKVGDVIYGIDHDCVKEFNQINGSQDNYYLIVPIGEVSIAGSREKLSFDERTEKYITEIIKKMTQEIAQAKIDKVEEADNLFSFRDLVESSVKFVQENAKFEGKTLEEWKQEFDIILPFQVEYFNKDWGGLRRYKTTEGQVFNPVRKKAKRKVFMKDTKVGGIAEFKQNIMGSGQYPMFTDEAQMNEFIRLMQWDGCEIIRSSVLRADKPKRKPKATAQVEVLRRRKDGYITRYTLNEFDTNSVEKDVLFVETSRDYWIDPEDTFEDKVRLHDFEQIKDAMKLGLINDTVFLIRSATVKRLINERSKVYNENFKRYKTDNVWDLPVTEADREELKIKAVKERVKLDDSIVEMFGDSALFDKREKRLLSIAKGRDYDKNVVSRFSTIGKHLGNRTGSLRNLHWRTRTKIESSVSDFSEGLRRRILKQYPFMEMALSASFGRGIIVDIKPETKVYLRKLIEMQDAGYFNNEEVNVDGCDGGEHF